MKKLLFGCIAATLLVSGPAAANPCMSDLFTETYATEGLCEAAIATKRNEIRQFWEMRGGDAAGMNAWVRSSFECEETSDGWIVVYVG